MPSRPQAKFSVAAFLDGAVDAAQRHPGRVVLLVFAVTAVLYELGVLEPLDWWGVGQEVGR